MLIFLFSSFCLVVWGEGREGLRERGIWEGRLLCDEIDLDFWFLIFLFERDEKCVCHWAGWLAGWLAVFVAWPTTGISDRIFGHGNFEMIHPINHPIFLMDIQSSNSKYT